MKFLGKVKVIQKNFMSDEIFRVHIERPEGLEVIKPGQFFNIKCAENGMPYLRRPISISGITEKTIELTIKIVGEGTLMLSKINEDDFLDIMGPLGNGFETDIPKETGKILLIGGGIGVAPLKGLGNHLNNYLKETHKIHSVIGFKDQVYFAEAFDSFSEKLITVSENIDAEADMHGYVTESILTLTEEVNYDMVYICGPYNMMKTVHSALLDKAIKMQFLMEERMACGIGACLVCTCKTKTKENKIANKRVCKDGPMFYGNEVVFDE